MTQLIRDIALPAATVRATAGGASADLAREVDYVLDHPRFSSSQRSRKLLAFLAADHQAAGVSQSDIAKAVIGCGSDFDPAEDAHARIAVCRLRKALAVFYEAHGAFRAFRIEIPKGRYLLALVANPQGGHGVARTRPDGPALAWTITAPRSIAAESRERDLAGALARDLSKAPLVHDGALRAQHLSARSVDEALQAAGSAGIPVLAETVIGSRPGTASVRVRRVRDGKVIWRKPLAIGGDVGADRELASRISTCLTDPLTGALPGWLAAMNPRSRLAVAMRFFRFMATQDRASLPAALLALNEIEGTGFASPLTRALRLDAVRANYCFATGHQAELARAHVDEAAGVLESDPGQPYACLAHGYMKMTIGGTDAGGPEWDDANAAGWVGSPAVDRDLYRALNAGSSGACGTNGTRKRSDQSFLSRVSAIIVAMRNGDFAGAEARAFQPGMPTNFWTRVFQCATALELGNVAKARGAHARLLDEVPGAEDFAGRAVTRMIPDQAVHDRILFHLAMLG